MVGTMFLCIVFGIAIGMATMYKIRRDEFLHLEREDGKGKMLLRWIEKISQKGSTGKYFTDRNYSNIAIYGYMNVGKVFERMLENEGLEVKCFIDEHSNSIFCEKQIVKPDEIPTGIDVIVVTPLWCYSKVKQNLENNCSCPVISISDVIEGMT